MIMADVFRILFLILGVLIVVVCYWLLAQALFPPLVERSRDAFSGRPVKTFFVGLFVGGPAAALSIGLLQAPGAGGKILGASIGLAAILAGLLGSAGLTQLIGERLPSSADDGQPWRKTLRGGVILSITFVFPFLGWFFLLPVTLLCGVGASTMYVFGRKRSAPAEPKAEALAI